MIPYSHTYYTSSVLLFGQLGFQLQNRLKGYGTCIDTISWIRKITKDTNKSSR